MSALDGHGYAFGGPLGRAEVAYQAQDFRVDEQLGFSASGDGPHLLIQIQKTGLSTTEAIRRLAQFWSIAPRDFGYAGRKDRSAVTRQWLTLPWPVNAALPAIGVIFEDAAKGQHLGLHQVARHRRKLPVGSLVGNRFGLTLRSVSASTQQIESRLITIARCGVPNYFGPQRFGRNAENLARAISWFGGSLRPRDRGDRSLLLSAARSACFNAVLSGRVADGDWAVPRPEDLMVLDGRGSLFAASDESPVPLLARAAGLRIHPTGPLPGRPRKGLILPPPLQRREMDLLNAHSTALADCVTGLVDKGVEMARRPLRVAAGGLAWFWPDPQTLHLAFTLPKGAYATSLLRELIEWEHS